MATAAALMTLLLFVAVVRPAIDRGGLGEFLGIAALEMHPLDTNERIDLIRAKHGLGFCNITKCCTEVCPEDIHITDNAIIPLKERMDDAYFDPLRMLGRALRGRKEGTESGQ